MSNRPAPSTAGWPAGRHPPAERGEIAGQEAAIRAGLKAGRPGAPATVLTLRRSGVRVLTFGGGSSMNSSHRRALGRAGSGLAYAWAGFDGRGLAGRGLCPRTGGHSGRRSGGSGCHQLPPPLLPRRGARCRTVAAGGAVTADRVQPGRRCAQIEQPALRRGRGRQLLPGRSQGAGQDARVLGLPMPVLRTPCAGDGSTDRSVIRRTRARCMLVFRNFPLDIHPNAHAGRQGRFLRRAAEAGPVLGDA